MIPQKLIDKFRAILLPSVKALHKFHVKPTHLTWAGLIFSLGAGLVVMTGHFFLGFFLGLLAGLMDALDGLLARESKSATRPGMVLDSSVDRYSDFFLLAGFILYYRSRLMINFIFSLAALLGSFMVSYAQAKGEAMGVQTPPGIMKRQDRWVVLLGGLFLSGISRNQIPNFLALGSVAVLANLSAVKRLIQIAKKSNVTH